MESHLLVTIEMCSKELVCDADGIIFFENYKEYVAHKIGVGYDYGDVVKELIFNICYDNITDDNAWLDTIDSHTLGEMFLEYFSDYNDIPDYIGDLSCDDRVVDVRIYFDCDEYSPYIVGIEKI